MHHPRPFSSFADAEIVELQRLLYDRFESLDEVITLLWLAAHAEHAWSPQVLAVEIGIDEYSMLIALKHLADLELISLQGAGLGYYRYAPELTTENDGVLGRLHDVHQNHRVLLVRILLLNALLRLREFVTDEAVRFDSDAFVRSRAR